MQNQIMTIRDSFFSGVTTFMNFIPTLVGALIILAIGWMLSSLIARLVERILVAFKVDQATIRTGLDRFLIGPRGGYHASYGIAFLAKWFIRLIFLQAAANLLQMPQVTAILNSILLFIPNLAVALLIIIAGVYLGQFSAGVVQEAVGRSGVGRPDLFALMTRYAIVGFALIAALNHIGIALVVVDTLLIGLVASLALAVGLAFGLGGQHVASEFTRNLYEQNKGNRLKPVSGNEPEAAKRVDRPGKSA